MPHSTTELGTMMLYDTIRARTQTLRYVLLGSEDLGEKSLCERYFAIALRIENESEALAELDLRHVGLRTPSDRECPVVAAFPEKATKRRDGMCVIEPDGYTPVTLAFRIPQDATHLLLRLPRDTNATSFEQRTLSLS